MSHLRVNSGYRHQAACNVLWFVTNGCRSLYNLWDNGLYPCFNHQLVNGFKVDSDSHSPTCMMLANHRISVWCPYCRSIWAPKSYSDIVISWLIAIRKNSNRAAGSSAFLLGFFIFGPGFADSIIWSKSNL